MSVDVPCGNCTACCRAFSIWIEPGERAELYRTVPVVGGKNGQRMLERLEDGACVYLTPKGCSIYEHRPKGCRSFDCRELGQKFPTRAMRRDAVKTNPLAAQVIARGRELTQHVAGFPPPLAGDFAPAVTGGGVFQGGSNGPSREAQRIFEEIKK